MNNITEHIRNRRSVRHTMLLSIWCKDISIKIPTADAYIIQIGPFLRRMSEMLCWLQNLLIQNFKKQGFKDHMTYME